MVERYLRGASRQDKRKRNTARGRGGGRGGMRDDLEDGFEEELLEPPKRSRRSRPKTNAERTAPAGTVVGTVLSVARGSVRVRAREGVEERDIPLSGAVHGVTLAVGDELELEPRRSGPPRIVALRERRSELVRPDPGNRHRSLVIAANVDVGVIVVAAKDPPLRPALIDRYLIALERGGIRPLVCVNKVDLVTAEERPHLEATLAPYRALGLELVFASAARTDGLDELAKALTDRTAVLVGHSGVGKSSLLNALSRTERTEEGAVRDFDGRGRHTTTSSRLYDLPAGGRLIDTPGVRAFGLTGVGPDELREVFPGLEPWASGCRFGDCAHVDEPDCAVRAAAEAGSLSPERYRVYLRLRSALQEDGG